MKHLSNDHLILELKNLVSEETKLTSQILDYLKEVEARKLFLKMGFASLFEFCMKELKYSEGSAQRRISAMRLLKQVPEMREKIISGELTLSNVAQVQSFFNSQEKKQQALSKQEKLEVLKDIENTSTRECERKLLKLDPELVKKDRERAVTAELTEVRFTADQDFMKKLEQLKNILSHAKPHASTKEILELAMENFLEKKKANTQVKRQANQQKSPPAPAVENEKEAKTQTEVKSQADAQREERMNEKLRAKTRSRHINIHIKNEVMKQNEDQCAYQDPKSGRRCTGKRFIQFDHIIPISKGGETSVENLQTLCAAHNQLKSDHIL